MAVDELAPFLVENFQEIDKTKDRGSGSFGSVYHVVVNGFPCIAKRLHDILVSQNVGEDERRCIRRRFREECILLSGLRHPNVVQFIGVHYGESKDELTLVMEMLYTDLEKCLSSHKHISLPIQLSILLDVAYGLLYLHSRNPVVIHRDLKASNILLTSDMRAKLADLGVSKILDVHPLSEVIRTVCPGTPGVMPPEALIQNPTYSSKLDDFSFGILVLHVVNHEFPVPFETAEFRKGEMHIAKRSYALDKMGSTHCLRSMVIQCLQDNPEMRPTTSEICSALEGLCKQHDKEFKDVLDLHEALSALEITNVERREAELQEVIKTRERELRCALEEALAARQDAEAKTAQIKETKSRVKELENNNKVLSQQMENVRSALEKNLRQEQEKQKRAGKLKGGLPHNGGIGMNQGLRTELVALRKQVEEAHQMLEENIASSCKLHDDALVKTQQMKQYKKQVDGYKVQNGELKAEMDGLKAELGVYQQQAIQYREQLSGAQQLASNMEFLQRERDSLAAQLQMLKGRMKDGPQLHGRHYDTIPQENDRLMEHHNIPFPVPHPQPYCVAADVLRAISTAAAGQEPTVACQRPQVSPPPLPPRNPKQRAWSASALPEEKPPPVPHRRTTDPPLECRICNKKFRSSEKRTFRDHVNNCTFATLPLYK